MCQRLLKLWLVPPAAMWIYYHEYRTDMLEADHCWHLCNILYKSHLYFLVNALDVGEFGEGVVHKYMVLSVP